MIRNQSKSIILFLLISIVMITPVFGAPANPTPPTPPPFPIPGITVGLTTASTPTQIAAVLQILLLLTVIALAPSILIMLTSFVRIVVVLNFIKRALSLQEMPPNQVIIGLALFLTFFIMSPIFVKVNKEAVKPFVAGELGYEEAYHRAIRPFREFMFLQTREKDLDLFLALAQLPRPKNRSEVPTFVLIPAFIISELKTAFLIGALIYIPFIIIDMVVASVLMSMGMIMLPPVMISLPIKVIVFILVDGWHLITKNVVLSFHMIGGF